MSRRRWMLFVDGENFIARGQALMEERGIPLQPGPHYIKDAFLWMPGLPPTSSRIAQPRQGLTLEKFAIRAYFYTRVEGSPERIYEVRAAIRAVGFQPVVFAQVKNGRPSKGVDITLTKDVLVHAFHDNYDVAVLITGDGDYVPVVEEVKRMGKSVYATFFEDNESERGVLRRQERPASGLNPQLRLASDKFFRLTDAFVRSWTGDITGRANEDTVEQPTDAPTS